MKDQKINVKENWPRSLCALVLNACVLITAPFNVAFADAISRTLSEAPISRSVLLNQIPEAIINVCPVLSIGKAFSNGVTNIDTVAAGSFPSLVITITNNGATTASGVSLTDTLPTGLTVGTAPPTNTCGGTLSAPASGNTITLSGGSIPGGASCAISVTVNAVGPGNPLNNIPSGALVTSPDIGTNPDRASATLSILPTSGGTRIVIGKHFSPSTVRVGQQPITLTITINNPSNVEATDIAFTDTLNSGVTVSGATFNNCGPLASVMTTSNSIIFSGGVVFPQSPTPCTVVATVSAIQSGNNINTLPAGAVTVANTGGPNADAVATLNINPASTVPPPPPPPPSSPPTVTKVFDPDEICIFDSTTVVITLNAIQRTKMRPLRLSPIAFQGIFA